MRKLSMWAKNNPWKSRGMIVISHLLLICLACFLGIRLIEAEIDLPASVLYVSILTWIGFAIIYPSRSMKSVLKEKFYARQKTADFFIALSSFCVICYAANREAPVPYSQSSAHASVVVMGNKISKDPTAEEILNSLKYRDKSTLTKKEKRILKKEFGRQVKIYVKAKLMGDNDEAGNAGLIILTIVAAIGLLFLVASAACSLSCNGMDGAALAVGIFGTAGIVIATIAIIRRIKRGPKKKKEPEMEENGLKPGS